MPPQGISNSVQIYASGAMPGLLQPGERIRVPVYYAGLQAPWDFSDSSVELELVIRDADNQAPVNWAALLPTLRPDWIEEAAWAAVSENLQDQLGLTWGDYINTLSANAKRLAQLGITSFDAGQLYDFEVQQAIGLSAVPTLAAAVDTSLPIPGLPLELTRTFGSNLQDRNRFGPFGTGWSVQWQPAVLEEVVDYEFYSHDRTYIPGLGDFDVDIYVAHLQIIQIRDGDGGVRIFTPDSRDVREFFSQAGDTGKLRRIPASPASGLPDEFELTESNGTVTRFRGASYAPTVMVSVAGDIGLPVEAPDRQFAVGMELFTSDTQGNRLTPTFSSGKVTRLDHSSGAWAAIAYTPAGLIASITDSAGRMITYAYDASNTHLLTATGPAGTTTYSYYSGAGTAKEHALRSVTSPGAVTRHFEYDEQGRLSATYLAGNAERLDFVYDSTGMVETIDATGLSVKQFVDNWGQVRRHGRRHRSLRAV